MIVKNYMDGTAMHLKGFDPRKYKTPGGMARGLYKALCDLAAEYGQDSSEVTLRNPEQNKAFNDSESWYVGWEAGPYEWAVMFSMSEEMYENKRVYAEPYYSFDLNFYS